MLTCQELTRWIASEGLAEAKRSVRVRAWIHLLVCRHCRRYAGQIRAIGASMRKSLGGTTKRSEGLGRLEAIILQHRTSDRAVSSSDPETEGS